VKHRAGLLALILLAACGGRKTPAIAGRMEAGAPNLGFTPVDASGAAPPDAGAAAPDAIADAVSPEAAPDPEPIEVAPTGPLTLDEITAPTAMAGNDYALPLRARGGKPPYSWTVSAGALPGGLALAGGAGGTAQVSGQPAHAGSAAVTIQVADTASATATRAFTQRVRGRPWATYRASGGTYLVDLARNDSMPIKAQGLLMGQPGGSVDLLRSGAVPADGGTAFDFSYQGIDLGGAELGQPVPLVAPNPDFTATSQETPAWSPDGKWLAFVAGPVYEDKDLFVADTTARPGVARRVNAARAAGASVSYFRWAGGSLVYALYDYDVRQFSLNVVSVDPPGDARPLGSSLDHYGWSSSPDGSLLIYLTEELGPGYNNRLRTYHLLGLNGQGPETPVELEGDLFTTDGPSPKFVWSDDSKGIEFPGVGPGGNAAWLRRDLATPNAPPKVVFEGPCKGGSFARSPDQRWLAVAGCGLWLGRLDKTPLSFQQLIAAPGEDESGVNYASWTPDGRRLVYVAKDGLEAIDTTGEVPGAAVVLYAGLPSGYKTYAFAPDGTKLAVRVVSGPREEIYLIPFTGPVPGPPVKMSADAAPGAYQYTPQYAGVWSPDSTRFVYEVLVGPNFEVFAASVDGVVPTGARRLSVDGQHVDCCQTPNVIQR
jgi:Tol biopolymer transport system component